MTQIPRNPRQRGSVLIVSLIMLVMLTILAISSLGSSTMQERMAANTHLAAVTFTSAEAGLRTGEFSIGNPDMNLDAKPAAQPRSACEGLSAGVPRCALWQPSVAANTGPWDSNATGVDRYRSWAWWQDNALSYAGTLPQLDAQPRYLVEELGAMSISNSIVISTDASSYQFYYQITAFSVGRSPNTPTVLQSIYGRIF